MQSFGLETRLGADVMVEIYLNGALVAEKMDHLMTTQSLAIQHEVVPGHNELVILATSGGVSPYAHPQPITPANPATVFVEADLDMDTVRDIGDSYEITSEPLHDVRWRPAEGKGDMVVPHRVSVPFTAPPGQTAPVWTRATPVQADAMRELAAAALTELRDLLQQRDLAGFQARMQLRNEDMARAYPLSGNARERAAQDAESLEETLADPDLRFPEIDPAGLILRSFADGRILDVRGPDGQPPLRAQASGKEPAFFAVTFAMIGGKLVPIR